MKWRAHTFDCSDLTWEKLTARLQGLLALRALSDDRFVIVSDSESGRFVQFASDGASGGIRCEAISNYFLTNADRLNDDVVRALIELGWKQPTTDIPNFWRGYKTG